MFHVGQKVVCIDDEWIEDGIRIIPPGERSPFRNSMYTIRSIHDLDGCYLRLEEIVNPECEPNDEVCFEACAFRPVTDISIFTSMLNNAPVRDKVPTA